MDTSRAISDRSLPFSCPPTVPSAAPVKGAPHEPERRAARAFRMRTVLRAARRHWWQILILWGLGSAALLALVQARLQPGYEATAWLQSDLAGTPTPPPASGRDRFLETQVQLLTSPLVLGRALADPEIRDLAWVQRAADPQTPLRDALRVRIPPQTNLILVSMTRPHREEAARLVNAVVHAYLEIAASWKDQEAGQQRERLQALQDQHRRDRERYRAELDHLVARTGNANPGAPLQVEAERYRQYRVRQGTIEIERMETEAALDALRATRRGGAQAAAAESSIPGGLEQAVERAYLADPEVLAWHARLNRALSDLRDAERLARNVNSAAVLVQRRRVEELRAENERLWVAKQPLLRARLGADPTAAEIQAAELRLAKLRSEDQKLRGEVEKLRAESCAEGSEALRAQYLASELNSATELQRRVTLRLEQLQGDAPAAATMHQVSAARSPRVPARDLRALCKTAAPLAMLATLIGLFTLVEARAARVVAPEDLSARLRLDVLGVVPPLPDRRPVQGPRALRAERRRLDEFVQSLDYLRVALEVSAGPGRHHRCVMIASASRGEGKTTLAAQLAGRCANAGLTTLLIDADLRRPALGELLQVPEGPGLAEVLLDEVDAEEAVIAVPEAGGFYLLPAGGDGLDPSRLLQSERLGSLLGRLRAAFDVVLIDVPPVLPVPDALLIGRWTDGAVMAVRRDTSRFPLVEQARQRLTAIGIPVLGAVVNGCRPSAATDYGAYGSYSQDRADQVL